MISICHPAARFRAASLLAALCLVAQSAKAQAPAGGATLDLFLKARVETILEKSNSFNDAKDALQNQFRTIRSQQGSLAPLCAYLGTRNDIAMAKPLLAMALAANEQYEAAAEVLAELAKNSRADPWVSSELTRVRQMIDVQRTWNLLGTGKPATLSADEKLRIDGILALAPADARASMKGACRDFLMKYGDLALLIGYLRDAGEAPQRGPLLAIAAAANGDIVGADEALSGVARDSAADPWNVAELGRIKEMQGRTDDAIMLFKRALERLDDPGVRFALNVRIAQLLYDSDKPKEAGDTLRSLMKAAPDTPLESRNFCARIAGMHGDHALVAEFFQPAGNEKEMPLNLLYLGETLLKLNKPGEARQQFEAALRLSKLARDRRYIIDRVISAARAMNTLPQFMDDWLKLKDLRVEQLEIMVGVLGGELGRIGDVFALFERHDLPEDARKLIDSPGFQERLAALAMETDKFEEAARTYRELIARHPDEPSYRDGHVRLLLMNGDRDAATSVYREAMAKTAKPGDLMRIAAGARRTGLRDVAIEAADKAGKMGEKSPLQSGLFMASLYSELGETDKALEILQKLERDSGDADADSIMSLSDAFERLGYGDKAILLCRKASELSGSERILRKLISLLETHNRNDEAFSLWRKLWDTAEEPMTIIQANDRLLELGSRNGKLADLAVELEDRISGPGLSEKELTLLLDIYTSVGDPVSAADVIMEISEAQGGESIATYERLLKVYMECELFGRCTAILRKLIEIEPENRDEHLQLLAVIALERRNNGDAMVVLEELAGRSEDGILRDSFSASVLNMLGKPMDAALAFRRGLAVNPDEVESWLLWGNALAARDAKERAEMVAKQQRPPAPQTQAGNKQTCGLFTAMLEEAEENDFFVICIDGLINASAPPYSMLNALRRLNERIAADPHNMLLYRLAADLNEEIKRPARAAGVLESSLTEAGDSRSIIMRELIGMAKAANSGDDAIRFGRSMLNFTEHLPPDECLALGTMLLERGHAAEAQGAFQRILSDPNAAGAARGVASAYENAGLFDKASEVIRTLLIENPFDVELMLRLGLAEEKRGNFEEAGKACSRALDMMLTRLPRREATNGASRNEREFNVTDHDQFGDLAVRSLIASVRTPEDCRQLLASSREKVRAEVANLETHDDFATGISENPRLKALADVMRRLGLVFNHPECVDEMDAELLRRYPGDSGLRASASSARRMWLTAVDAGNFMAGNGMARGETELIAAAFVKGREAVEEMLKSTSLTPSGRSTAGVLLTIFGYDDLIGKTLAGCDLNQTSAEDGELLVAAGLASNRPDLVRDVILTNLNRLRRELEPLAGFDRSRAYLRPTALYKQIVAAWPVLSPQDRSTAASIYGMCLEKPDSASELTASYQFLLCLAGRSSEIGIDNLRHYLDRGGFYYRPHLATIFDHWIGDLPAKDRPAAVRRLLESKAGEERASALSQLDSYLSPGTLKEELRKEFPELVPSPQMPMEHTQSDMVRERQKVATEIAGALSGMGSDVRRIFPLHDITLLPAANMLPPEQLDILIQDYGKSGDAFELLTKFLLLRQAGREAEALPLVDDIAALPRNDAKVEAAMAALPHILATFGWNMPALRLMRKSNSATVRSLKLDFDLHDPLSILADTTGSPLDVSIRRVHATRLMASSDPFKQAASIYHADTRHPDLVGNSRLGFTASIWPPRIATSPGGLLGMRPQPTGSFLSDVALLGGGQEDLMSWLRSISPDWYTNEAEICNQIAADAAHGGLSPEIRGSLQEAAGRSGLNRFDLKLIEALAREAPGELPDGLAGQLEKLALHDWRGDSRYDERLTEARKRMGLNEGSARRLAAIAAVCHSLGRQDLASALGRWAVVTDIMDSGSSSYLTAYLDGLPEQARKQALAELMPYMGLSDVRPVTGEGFGALLDAMLREGMTDVAGGMVDRYLRERWATKSRGAVHSGTLPVMIGGLDADVNEKDDAVAVILARLGRPEDYERLLWKRNEELRVNRSPLNLGMSIGSVPLLDNTRALPEPGQVVDVNRYIDIQLAVIRRLRQEAVVGPEFELAQICMLGQWCAEHDLASRAVALLEQAEKLGTGMLAGRLWVADLQRILGKDSAAVEIEAGLLGHDMLPLARVPAALDAIDGRKGKPAAAAVAYRLADYTNDPKVLTRALRHAADEELRQSYLDLAERLRKVSTLFLPPAAPCPFEGYASVTDWSAAITATAAKLPDSPKPRPLVALADDTNPSISRVILKGDKPEMIYVPIIHDDVFSHLSAAGSDSVRDVMAHCEEIAGRLYHRYGVRNVLLEGLSKSFVDQYNRIPLQRRSIIGDNNAGMIVHRTWTRLLAEKAWVLLPASDRELVGPLTELGREYEARIVAALDKAKSEGWLRNSQVYETNKPTLEAQLKAIAGEYNAKHSALLEEDPGLKREYDITVTRRNKAFLDHLFAAKQPGVVFFGVGHWQDLERQLAERNTSYAVVVPAGMSWPPAPKDDATIYAEMLELGAKLRECALKLGDGSRTSITIPID